MSVINSIVQAISPYEFSWLAAMFFGTVAFCYFNGQFQLAKQGSPESKWKVFSFWLGLILCYVVMHTRFDYFAQFMFFVHRGQHLILHHLGPILIVLATPWSVLNAGFPKGRVKQLFGAVLASYPVALTYRVLQYPFCASLLFVGLIFFWLSPEIHFDAMLSQSLYLLMNWSMFLDGILFWWLILDPRDPVTTGNLGFGKRIVLLWAAMVPQLILGASIVFKNDILYDVYAVCGRAWPIEPINDQILGGLLTWIPPGMMTVVVSLILLKRLLRYSEENESLSSNRSVIEPA